MKTIAYKSIRDGVVTRLGIDASMSQLPSQAAAVAEYSSSAIAYAWTFFDWPEIHCVEERATTNSEILLIQNGATPIGAITAIYDSDPETNAAVKTLEFAVSDDRISIIDAAYTGGNVWVEFDRTLPVFTSEEYSAGTTYDPGDVVYFPSTGDCYVAVQQSTGIAPTNTTNWLRHIVPHFLGDFLKLQALAEMLSEDGQMDKANFQFSRAEGLLLKAMDDAWLRKGEIRRFSFSTN